MVVIKILEATLIAGSTSVTFTDTDIPNSLLRVYCTRSSLFPISQTLSGNSVTVTYKPQDSNIGVALEIVKSGLDIVDDLVTDDSTKALSANQGYVLKGLIDDIVIPTVPENITDLDDVSVTDIENGQVLAWNSLTEKFVNVDQSGGSSGHNYSEDEQIIGTWLDGSTLYEKTITGTTNPNTNVMTIEVGGDTVIRNFYGVIGGVRLINSYIDSASFAVTWIAGNLHQLGNSCSGSIYQNKSFYVTVEYTKTS